MPHVDQTALTPRRRTLSVIEQILVLDGELAPFSGRFDQRSLRVFVVLRISGPGTAGGPPFAFLFE